jgi:hypothetical protein
MGVASCVPICAVLCCAVLPALPCPALPWRALLLAPSHSSGAPAVHHASRSFCSPALPSCIPGDFPTPSRLSRSRPRSVFPQPLLPCVYRLPSTGPALHCVHHNKPHAHAPAYARPRPHPHPRHDPSAACYSHGHACRDRRGEQHQWREPSPGPCPDRPQGIELAHPRNGTGPLVAARGLPVPHAHALAVVVVAVRRQLQSAQEPELAARPSHPLPELVAHLVAPVDAVQQHLLGHAVRRIKQRGRRPFFSKLRLCSTTQETDNYTCH